MTLTWLAVCPCGMRTSVPDDVHAATPLPVCIYCCQVGEWIPINQIPRMVGAFFFKPHEETVWPVPVHDEALKPTPEVLGAIFSAYHNLLTHPCGVEMLREARRGWKVLAKKQRTTDASGAECLERTAYRNAETRRQDGPGKHGASNYTKEQP